MPLNEGVRFEYFADSGVDSSTAVDSVCGAEGLLCFACCLHDCGRGLRLAAGCCSPGFAGERIIGILDVPLLA